MGKPRTSVAKRPSRAQGAFLDTFEEHYRQSNEQLESDIDIQRRKHPELAPKKSKRFSKSTYHSWRRQDTSPTIHDLEILCRVSGERQTLIVDPSATTTEEVDDMEWLEQADELMREMGNLTELQRGAVLHAARAEMVLQRARATRNPQESDAASGPRSARRK